MGLTIGVDVGGTKIAAGLVDEDGRIVTELREPTPDASSAAVTAGIAAAVARLRAQAGSVPVVGVGVGAAGFVDASRSTVLFGANVAWRNEPLQAEIARLVGLPVVVENDANATAWGEYRFGAGRGEDHLVTITVGTGIGGGIILGGQLYRGRFGIAGEPGHMQVVPDGRRCGCGLRGCWEQYCSGHALVREVHELSVVDESSVAHIVALAGGHADAVDGPVITRAAQEGDPAAVECFGIIGRWLGVGLANLAEVLDPGRFVIGGGVGDAGDLLLAPARQAFAQALSGSAYRPSADIVPATLGASAGLVGAADLARQ